jgi:hypothetical protein
MAKIEESGKLSESDKRKIVDWLNKMGADSQCSVCDNDLWIVGDHLLHGTIFHGGSIIIGGPVYPQFFVYCDNCYNVRHFLAGPLELFEDVEKEDEGGSNG